jgi:hypothetical protein
VSGHSLLTIVERSRADRPGDEIHQKEEDWRLENGRNVMSCYYWVPAAPAVPEEEAVE